jgi:hypothetical protein
MKFTAAPKKLKGIIGHFKEKKIEISSVFHGLGMAFSKSRTVKQQPAGADRCLFGIIH